MRAILAEVPPLLAPVTNRQCQIELQLQETLQRLVLCEQSQRGVAVQPEFSEWQTRTGAAIREIREAIVDLAARQISLEHQETNIEVSDTLAKQFGAINARLSDLEKLSEGFKWEEVVSALSNKMAFLEASHKDFATLPERVLALEERCAHLSGARAVLGDLLQG